MSNSFRALVVLTVVLASGCSSGDVAGVGVVTGTGTSGTCTVTVAGGSLAAGSYSCTTPVVTWGSSNNTGGITIPVTGPATVTVGIGWNGEPVAGTYTNTNNGATAGVSVSSNLTSVWIAAAGGATASGSYSLVFSSVSTTATVSSGKTYTVHGTLDATLPAVSASAATGTVTMHVAF